MDKVAFLKEVIAKKNLKGVSVTADAKILYTKGSFELGPRDSEGTAVKSAQSTKEYGIVSDDDLKIINKLSRKKFKAEDIFVTELYSASTKVDRGYEHFTKQALQDMADMSPNKPVLCNHNWKTDSVVGKIYAAEVRGNTLVQKIYMPRRSAEKAIAAVEDGIWDKVSVGFGMDPEDIVCDTCKTSLYMSDCPHWPGYSKDDDGEYVTVTLRRASDYYEISFVPVPMQADASTAKAEEEEEVETKELGTEAKEYLKAAIASAVAKQGLEITPAALKETTERLSAAVTAQVPETLTPKMVADLSKSIAEIMDRIEAIPTLEQIKSQVVDTISTVKTTTEDSSQMADEENKNPAEVEDAAKESETKPADESAEVKPAEEGKGTEPEDAKTKEEAPKVEEPKEKATTESIEMTKLAGLVETLTKSIEPVANAQKALDERLKSLEASLKSLETLVEVASKTSLDAVKELVTSKGEVEGEQHWFRKAFGAGLGGQ